MKKIRIRGSGMPLTWKKCLNIMKLTFLFLLIGLMQVSASVYSQTTRLTLDMKKSRVIDVLDEIERQSEFRFAYSTETVNTERRVTLSVDEKSIEEALAIVFEGTGIRYVIDDRHIVLYQDMADNQNNAQQQDRVTGTVTDKKGEPLPGVSVIVKGTVNGTVTNANGEYSLTSVTENSVLQFSFIGLKSQEVEVGENTRIDISLEEDAFAIDEVVAIGYGTQKKVNLTGSITSVKTEELVNIPAGSLSNSMAGRAPGVQVIGNSGLAGATSSISIRGGGTPLFVIDNIISDKSDFDALDANEVESINFLKDAASAAVYGSQAGNGVVIVTTKKGAVQKPKFEYKSSFSTSRTTQAIQTYTAQEELQYLNDREITLATIAGREPNIPYGQDVIDYFADKTYDINDLIWQDPNSQQHNLSVNGGSEAISYYMALGYHKENGSYHNTDYDRYNFRSNVTANVTKRFKINLNLSGNQRNYNRWYWPYDGSEDQAVGDWFRSTFNWSRLRPFYVAEDGTPTNDPNDYPVGIASGFHPPEIMLHGGYRDTKYRTLNGILRFDLDLGQYVDGLKTSFQSNITAYDRNMKSFVKHNKWYVFQSAGTGNKFIPGPIDFTQMAGHSLSNAYENVQEDVTLSTEYQVNWFLNYDKTFGDHEISALAVYEQRGYNDKNVFGRAEQLLSSSIDQIYNASSDTERRWFTGSEGESAASSWIGRVNYSYASKYIVDFSFRYDGSYFFAPENRWGFFPSVSAAWRLSEEKFMKNIDWLSNLKLRGSFGTTGNISPIGPWRWTNKYQKVGGYVFGSSFMDGLQPGAMPNYDITWETVENWDLGFDYGLFDNKLTGEFSVWGKTRKDILGERLGSTPSTLGASLPAVNYAQQSLNGFEISASYKNKLGELNYEVYANMGYTIDKWDKWDEAAALTDGTYKDNWRSRIGHPDNRVYGLICKGMIRTQEQLDELVSSGYTVYGRQPIMGTLMFEDIRGDNYSEGPDGKIDANDMTYLSDNGAPRINYGWGVNLDWKGFTVNAHFQGVGAYDRMVATRNSTGGGVFQIGDRPYFEMWARDYWTPENPDAELPRVSGAWLQAEYAGTASTYWMKNGAYMRLKNLNIGYDLPSQWFSKIGVSKVQLFVNGTNLFVLTGFKEYDPEQATLDSYPLMKTFTGGVNINF
ncbi:SusC/RagA family TonB-linked outer membrane protein [Maribellus luteus]|uniref:SusC/RagA family TonB-linked outer membrane protein n=2 Tax=Maribellus luteus TaxID=2305463 RepID=A0A399SRF8_9BACT|nr:SusC/RagA family TonB-linked outer membrane protein [Maribellus luteus]